MSVTDSFRKVFEKTAEGTGAAPARVNLIGEHVDYNGGKVLPAALTNHVSVALAENTSKTHTIISDRFEGAVTRTIADNANGHWSDYIVGALQHSAKLGWGSQGFDIYVASGIPPGAGISSSAALITAVFRAAMDRKDAEISAVDTALEARKVENAYIGVPCGIMDQMAVGMLQPGEALALDTASMDTEVMEIPSGWTFVTLHSGINRALTDGRYKTRFQECASATAELGANWLCQLTDEQISRIPELNADLAARARHVVSEHRRTNWAIGAMRADDMDTFGRLMRESHRSYSEDFDASTPEIDALVKSAEELGAIGSRLTGGGFGGCFVSLVPGNSAEDWKADMLSRHPGIWAI
ncbi:MAG: galactokinase [Pseudomonadota bacterium]